MSLALTTLRIIVLVVMAFGLAGLVVPILPGLVIIWVAALAYGLAAGFTLPGGIIFGVMTLIMLGGSVVDNVLMGASARTTGASWWAIGAALVAGVAGSLLLPPVGGIIAALLVLFLIEFSRVKDWRSALHSTREMALGCGWSVVVRVLLGMIMILLWVLWAFVLTAAA